MHRHLGVEDLEEVPGDRLTLAILVGCEVQLVRLLQRLLEERDLLLLAAGHGIEGLEVVVDVDSDAGPLLALERRGHLSGVAREIANVAYRRLDDVSVTEVARNGSGLRRGLDYDQSSGHGC